MEKHKTGRLRFVRAGKPPRTFFIPPSHTPSKRKGRQEGASAKRTASLHDGGRDISKTHQPTGHSSPLRPRRTEREGREHPQHEGAPSVEGTRERGDAVSGRERPAEIQTGIRRARVRRMSGGRGWERDPGERWRPFPEGTKKGDPPSYGQLPSF